MPASNRNNIHLSSLECTKKRQIASLLSHAFRDLPFSIALLTDSLVYLQWGRLVARKINVSGVIFPSLSLRLCFPGKKKFSGQDTKWRSTVLVTAHQWIHRVERLDERRQAPKFPLFNANSRSDWKKHLII